MDLDSDSSDSSVGLEATNVMLGYASVDPTDDDFSQLGGFPTWPDASNPPSSELAKCKTCNKHMCLFLQLNADLPERYIGHERRLYVFTCKSKACRRKAGSIRAIRGVKIPTGTSTGSAAHDQQKSTPPHVKAIHPPSTSAANMGGSIFLTNDMSQTVNRNPFSLGPKSPQNPFSSKPATSQPTKTMVDPGTNIRNDTLDLVHTFASKASLANGSPTPQVRTPWPTESTLPPPYPTYFLDAGYESLNPSTSPSASSRTTRIDTDTELGTDDPETYESTIDKTFQRFASRLSENPEQVLRYEFGGSPLLYSKTDITGKLLSGHAAHSSTTAKVQLRASRDDLRWPPCENCGAKRVFELQLVPHAITMLEVDELGLDGMDWGTIIVGVCERDCAERGVEQGEWGWVEEWVGVQWEEQSTPSKPA